MKQIITKLLEKEIPLKEKEIENLIEIPWSSELGDYAFPCFALSKKLKKSPNEIAKELKEKIKLSSEIERIEVVGAYLNFFVDKKAFARRIIKKILKEKKEFGSLNIGKKEKVVIEHTSINPNASPHVGRARNALIGDSITRLFRFLGFKTEVHYYINDVSKQIAMLVLAGAEKLKFEKMLEEYVKISKKVQNSEELEKEVFELLNKFEKGDKEIAGKFRKIVDVCVKGQEKILSGLGIKYDFFDYESSYLKDAGDVLSRLKSRTFID